MNPMDLLKTVIGAVLAEAAKLMGLGAADKARLLIGLALDYIPLTDLHSHLDDVAKERDDALAQAAEAAKFGA